MSLVSPLSRRDLWNRVCRMTARSVLPPSATCQSLGVLTGSSLKSQRQPGTRSFTIPTSPARLALTGEFAEEGVATPQKTVAGSGGLVSTAWLEDNLDRVVVLDATWYLQPKAGKAKGAEDEWAFDPKQALKPPAPLKNARKEYSQRHIRGARFFDLDEVSDRFSTMPHMLPTAEEFDEHISALGINVDDHVVIYDSQGIFSAPRVWWTFKAFGHKNVSVLDGGLPKWVGEGRPVASTPQSPKPSEYRSELQEDMIIDYQDMLVHVTDIMYAKNFSVIDARPRDRFAGFAPEPRPIPSGHIPASINIPASDLVDPDTKTLLSKKDIMRRLIAENVDLRRPIVTMCVE
ncbi:hypothetical protein HKX48_003325 [Thoreauomyces humboldtii]|nr:hypothetical protein HKX48_003325 [Thoreauomyces humboldtii]